MAWLGGLLDALFPQQRGVRPNANLVSQQQQPIIVPSGNNNMLLIVGGILVVGLVLVFVLNGKKR